jgi:hypothetical protein
MEFVLKESASGLPEGVWGCVRGGHYYLLAIELTAAVGVA